MKDYGELAKKVAGRADLIPGVTRCGPDCLGKVLEAYDTYLKDNCSTYKLVPIKVESKELDKKELKIRYKEIGFNLQVDDPRKVIICRITGAKRTADQLDKIRTALAEVYPNNRILVYEASDMQIDLFELEPANVETLPIKR